MTPQPETDRDVLVLYMNHLREDMGAIWREHQAQMLISRLSDMQKYVLEQFYKQAIRTAQDWEAQAGAHALKALLEPHVGQHRVRAFFLHSKAKTFRHEKSRVASQLWGYTGSFEEFIRDACAGLQTTRKLCDQKATTATHMLLGKDSTSEEYIALRTQSVIAQGEVEGYDELFELLELLGTSRAASV